MKFNVAGETVSGLICRRESIISWSCFQLNLRSKTISLLPEETSHHSQTTDKK
jgi:hypothetical protein